MPRWAPEGMSDNRPAVYTEGTRVIYRASAIGGCLRALYAARSQMEPLPMPAIVQAGMDEGTSLEPVILEMLRSKYRWMFQPRAQQRVVELPITNTVQLNVTVRGALDDFGGPFDADAGPVDVKAFTPDQCELFHNKGFTAFPRYAWQQSTYAHATGSPIFYMPIFNKGTWTIEPWSLVAYSPPYSPNQIAARVLTVEGLYRTSTMPEDCPQDYACPYPYLHEGRDAPHTPPDESIPMMQARIRLSEKIRTLEQARKTLDEAIKPHLQQDISYTLDGYTVTVFANPARFNTQAAKRFLREAEIDYESDPEFTIPGKGTQVRFTQRKNHPDTEGGE